MEFILVFNEDDRNRKINLLFSGTENTIWMEGASKVEVVAVVWGWCEVGRGEGGDRGRRTGNKRKKEKKKKTPTPRKQMLCRTKHNKAFDLIDIHTTTTATTITTTTNNNKEDF